jgi:hypothetical protein
MDASTFSYPSPTGAAPTVYIGHDRREPQATQVARASLLANASIPLRVHELRETELRRDGLYDRPFRTDGNQRIDLRDASRFPPIFPSPVFWCRRSTIIAAGRCSAIAISCSAPTSRNCSTWPTTATR